MKLRSEYFAKASAYAEIAVLYGSSELIFIPFTTQAKALSMTNVGKETFDSSRAIKMYAVNVDELSSYWIPPCNNNKRRALFSLFQLHTLKYRNHFIKEQDLYWEILCGLQGWGKFDIISGKTLRSENFSISKYYLNRLCLVIDKSNTIRKYYSIRCLNQTLLNIPFHLMQK